MRKILLLLQLAFFGTAAFAQEIERDSIIQLTDAGYYFKAGLNYTSATRGNLDNNPDARTSFYIGAGIELPLNNSFSLQPEIQYSRQGFQRNVGEEPQLQHYLYKIDYINIPVTLKYYFVKGFTFDLGPQIGVRINSEHETAEDDEAASLGKSHLLDIGFVAGLGFKFDSGLLINLRFGHGFLENIDNSASRNTLIQVGTGFKF